MDYEYLYGGTLRTCPYSNSPEIIEFQYNGTERIFNRSQCSHSQECTDETCPLCKHLSK